MCAVVSPSISQSASSAGAEQGSAMLMDAAKSIPEGLKRGATAFKLMANGERSGVLTWTSGRNNAAHSHHAIDLSEVEAFRRYLNLMLGDDERLSNLLPL